MNQDTQTQALKVISADDQNPLLPATQPVARLTMEQIKDDGMAQMIANAYANAGKLKLTPEEMKVLKGDFPDEAFRREANGNPDLIYLEHAFLRDRLDELFGTEWAMIPRYWKVDFEYEKIQRDNSKKMERATHLYCELTVIARGCYFASAIDEMTYYESNHATSYTDAVEGAKSYALRRCCKERGIGLQAWKKSFVEGWKQRNPQGRGATPRQQPPPTEPPQQQSSPPPAQQAGSVDWRNVQVPFGKTDTIMGDMTRKDLLYWIREFKVQATFVDKKDGKTKNASATSLAKQKLFRLALDACAKELGV